MEAEEGERAATQRIYDQAQRDYSAQVLGDRAQITLRQAWDRPELGPESDIC